MKFYNPLRRPEQGNYRAFLTKFIVADIFCESTLQRTFMKVCRNVEGAFLNIFSGVKQVPLTTPVGALFCILPLQFNHFSGLRRNFIGGFYITLKFQNFCKYFQMFQFLMFRFSQICMEKAKLCQLIFYVWNFEFVTRGQFLC